MFSPEQVDLALFTAGIVLGAFSGPFLTIFKVVFEGDESSGAIATILTLIVTSVFFVAGFWALLNDAMGVANFWLWAPAYLLAAGLFLLLPILYFATGLEFKVGWKKRPPKTTTNGMRAT